MHRSSRAGVMALLVLGVSACSSTQKSGASAAGTPVNATCPIGGHSTAGTGITVDYKGQTVGFCCASCADEWNELTDADRSAKLKEAMAAK